MNIYVGNLSYDVSEENLRQAFEAFGQVSSARIVKDKYSGQPEVLVLSKCLTRLRPKRRLRTLTGKNSLVNR